jgi:glycosyl transferase family 2
MTSDGGVTVVIPVWDYYVRFLPASVESVRRNSPDASILIVDNASSIPVPDLADCEVVRSGERLTVGAARNLGLERVATEFLMVLDADDMLLDGALDHLRSRLEADPRLAIAATSILDAETGERHRAPRRFAFRLAKRPRLFAFLDSIWSLLPIQGSAMFRTAQVRAAGGYPDAQLAEDWVLAVSLAWRGRVEISDRLGRYYRATPGSFAGREWTRRELRQHARMVRDRIREDQGVPRWARALLPAIAVFQLTAIYLARPLYLALRGPKADSEEARF